MKCIAKTTQSNQTERCTKNAKLKYLFLWCHMHKPFADIFWTILWFVLTAVVSAIIGYYAVKWLIEDNNPFTATIHITDWKDRDNQEIYNKGGIITFDNSNKYDQPMNEKGTVNFPDLPSSYIGKDVQIKFQPRQEYGFMLLDTIIKIEKGKTYSLKMSFKGIDKITRKVIDENGNTIIDAVAEIKGVKDTIKADGIFTIVLTPDKQERIQKLTIKKDGFVDYVNEEFDMTVNNEYIKWELRKNNNEK